MEYFIVFQNKSYKEEHKMGILWAPSKDKRGEKPKFHWLSMLECKPGDVVFSVVQNVVVARGIVMESAIESQRPFLDNTWGNDGWLVEVDYHFIINKIKIQSLIHEIIPHLPNKYSPINPHTGRGNMGYLFPISNDLGLLLDSKIEGEYKGSPKKPILDISIDTSEMLHEMYHQAGMSEGEIIMIEEDPPTISNKPKSKITHYVGKKTDFIKKAEADKKTGYKAELLVVDFEKDQLEKAGKHDLAKKVKWVAEEADGYGYDVLSYDINGKEKYIEVKGTKLLKSEPFYVSANELETSKQKDEQYWIYRVFYVNGEKPRFYRYNGNVEKHFEVEPIEFKAYIKE